MALHDSPLALDEASRTRRMPSVPGWDVIARRQKRVFLDGLITTAPAVMPTGTPSIEEIRAGFADYWT